MDECLDKERTGTSNKLLRRTDQRCLRARFAGLHLGQERKITHFGGRDRNVGRQGNRQAIKSQG